MLDHSVCRQPAAPSHIAAAIKSTRLQLAVRLPFRPAVMLSIWLSLAVAAAVARITLVVVALVDFALAPALQLRRRRTQ